MSQQKETLFKNQVKHQLEKLPNICVMKIQQMSIRGIPDLIICLGGRFIAIELKSNEKLDPEPLQDWWLDKIMSAGGISLVANPQNWGQIYAGLYVLACKPPINEVKNMDNGTIQ